MKHVIVGNGIAGLNAARAIRELDAAAEIAMVSDERFPPYSRPMICQVLDGSQPHEKLPLYDKDIYQTLQVTPVLGARAVALDVEARTVRLADETLLDFDRLLIASGADARRLKAAGSDLDNIFYMRTEADVRRQLAAVGGARQALVLGGGLVGFKAAYGLLKRKLPVTMLITSGYPLSMQVDAAAGRIIQDELEANGLTVRVGVSASGFEGNGRVTHAVLDNGEQLTCDLVVVGKGVLPSLDFVPRERVTVDLGIVVDDYLQSSAPGIYAAGDTAEAVDIARQKRWVNAIWPEAAVQGRIAGQNMAGRRVRYPGSLSRNVMRVYGLDVMTLGHANPDPGEGLRTVQTGGKDHGYYRRLVFREDIMVGAVLINRIEQGGVLRALVENRVPIRVPDGILMAPGFNFSKLLH
jgi:NAD(P)H-nitrite reductase large subunit